MTRKTKIAPTPLRSTARLVLVLTLVVPTGLNAAEWPAPPERSGSSLPERKTLAVQGEIAGLYVPERAGLSTDDTGIIEASLTWNLRIVGGFGLFGEHSVARMWWSNISMLTFGHELGLRYLLGDHIAFEGAYLGHRAEYEWIDGNSWSIGGVFDHGGEVGAWGRVVLLDRLKVEPHLFGRRFAEPVSDGIESYTDQLVFGAGLRGEVLVTSGHTILAEVELLRVYRGHRRRAGVDEITLNTIGTLSWRARITDRLGLHLGVRASTNWSCGEAPMMEIKRSMVDEPMAKIFAGLHFLI
jgi:hypothetical protein